MVNFSTDGERIPMYIDDIYFEVDVLGYNESEGNLEIEYYYEGELIHPNLYYEEKLEQKINKALEAAIKNYEERHGEIEL